MSTTSKRKNGRLSYAHGNNLFERLDVTRLQLLLETLFPETRIQRKGASTLLMNCLTPGHPDVHPSFYINVGKNEARCASCRYYTRNLLQLLQDCKGYSYADAVAKISEVTNFRVVATKLSKDLEDLDNYQQMLRYAFRVCNQHLVNCLAPPEGDEEYNPALLSVAQRALDWLFGERGHKPEFVALLPYGLLPPQHLFLSLFDRLVDEDVAAQYASTGETSLPKTRRAAIREKAETLLRGVDGSWTHAVTFHTGHALSTPARLRLRRPTSENKAENFLTLPGHSDADGQGFLGLYSPQINAFSSKEREGFKYILVEGENDMLTSQEAVLQAGISDIFFLATGGNNESSDTDTLKDGGIDRVYMLSDHPHPDYGNGEEWLRPRLATATDVEARVFVRWPELCGNNLAIKDPDDVVRNLGFEHFRMALDPLSYSSVPQWAADRVEEEVTDIDVSEIRMRMHKAVEFGRCVRNPAELAAYLDAIEARVALPAGPLRSEIVKAGDSELGFIHRIAATIRHEFHTLYREDNGRGGTLHLYHRAERRRVHFYMTDGESMLSAMSNVFGNMYEYFRDSIGLPPGADEDLVTANPAAIKDQQKDLAAYLKIAMQIVYKGVPAQPECLSVGQGLHLLPDPETGFEEVLYLVNGNAVYRGDWIGPTALRWSILRGPSDGRYLFDTDGSPWTELIRSVEDLDVAGTYTVEDVKDAVIDVYKMFNSNWRFVHQELDSTYLAYHLAACAIAPAFATKTILSFVGQTASGKSTALAVFCGGQIPALQLLQPVQYQSSYTLASIYQAFNNSTLMMGLEEFTSDGALHKARQVDDISELLRQIVFKGGVVVRRGTAEGKQRVYRLHTNVVTSSIHVAKDSQDENRRFTVETVRKDGLRDPAIGVAEMFPAERYAELRRVLAFGMLRYMRQLKALHDQVEQDMSDPELVPFPVSSRFLRNFIPVASLMTLFGVEWKPFVRQTCLVRRTRLEGLNKDTGSANLLSQLLHTPGVPIGQGGRAAIQQLLGREEDWRQVNSSGCGFYYDDANRLGLVDWVAIRAPGGLLHRVPEYERSTVRILKHTLDQHPKALKEREFEGAGITQFLLANNIVADNHEISVVRLDEIVNRLRQPVPGVPVPGTRLSVIEGGGNVTPLVVPAPVTAPDTGESSNNI
jgi:hypothetical protein